MSSSSGSKYDSFLESYNKGFNQFQENLTTSFFLRIGPDITFIQNNVDVNDSFTRSKIDYLLSLSKNSVPQDAYSRLKNTGRTLQEIVTFWQNYTTPIKQHFANIINAFFDVAKETEDVDLLSIAASISKAPKA
jgi:hypothetical protein